MKNCKHKNKKNNQGFTLVEVLIAMAVLAIVSIPILSTFANASRINAKARRIENANTALNDIMEEAKSTTLVELNENKGTNYLYKYTGSDGIADLSVGSIASTNGLTYKITTKDEDGNDSGYFIGNDGEKYDVTAKFDPFYYNDTVDNGLSGSAYNNINSSGVSIYNDISNSGSFVYRDETTDELAVKELKNKIGGSFDVTHIQKITDINVDIAKLSTSTTVPIFVQILTITTTYNYYDGLPQTGGTVLEKYERKMIYELNKITPHVVEEENEQADGSITKNTYYVISSAAKYENNLKKVYVFYCPFDRAEKHMQGTNEVSNFVTKTINGTTSKIKYCNDVINIHYNYDNSAAVRYEASEVYLIEQDEFYQANPTDDKSKMEVRNTNVNTSYAYGSVSYNGSTNKIIYNNTETNTAASLFKVTPSDAEKTNIKATSPFVLNQYLYTNVLDMKTNSTRRNETNLMYRVTLKVEYKGEVIAEMTSTKVE